MKEITGGVCAAKGFATGAVHSGIRKARTKEDLALIVSQVPCQCAAAMPTPVRPTDMRMPSGKARRRQRI